MDAVRVSENGPEWELGQRRLSGTIRVSKSYFKFYSSGRVKSQTGNIKNKVLVLGLVI